MNIRFIEEGTEDAPLFVIYGTKSAEFEVFQRAALDLATGAAKSVSLNELPSFNAVDGCSLAITVGSRDRGVERQPGTAHFVWTLTPGKWKTVSGFVEPFVRSAEPNRHQWLGGIEARLGLDVGPIALVLSCNETPTW